MDTTSEIMHFHHTSSASNPTSDDFTILLPRQLLLHDNSSIELIEFRMKTLEKARGLCYVMTDVCVESLVNNRQLPVLRPVHLAGAKSTNKTFPVVFPVSTRPGRHAHFRVYLRDSDMNSLAFKVTEVNLTVRLNNVSIE